MGGTYLSVHFKTDDSAGVEVAAKKAAAGGAKFLIAPCVSGWIGVYPSMELLDTDLLERFAGSSRVEHAVAFMVYDSDILCYWYFKGGRLADYYHSSPDYFGETNDRDMGAKGNAEAFADLLDAPARKKLAALIGPRMVSGEDIGGEKPVFEEERLESLARILGIAGAMGSYDYLIGGEDVEGVGSAGDMVAIG